MQSSGNYFSNSKPDFSNCFELLPKTHHRAFPQELPDLISRINESLSFLTYLRQFRLQFGATFRHGFNLFHSLGKRKRLQLFGKSAVLSLDIDSLSSL